jgi:Fe-only nitrogenase accessory protein AnfO
MKIAAFVDENDNALPLYATGTVKLFVFEDNIWICAKSMPFSSDESMSLAEIRSRIQAVAAELGNCKVFVAESMKGVPFAVFEGMGYAIWKIKGDTTKYLDYIKEKEDKIQADKLKPKPAPVAIGDIRDGLYRIDLVKVLESDPSLTSKSVLLPFFQKTTFSKLEIICEHIPKWFGKEFSALKLKAEIQEGNSDGLCHAMVMPL